MLADGIVKIDAEWKFKKEDGSWAKSEFVTSKGNIYYIGEDEAALTGWHTIEDKLYHFDNDGKLSKGCSVMIQGFTTLTRTALRKTSG